MKIYHFKIFLHALRSALLIVAGFLAYELLVELEKAMKIKYHQRKLYKLLFIFMSDVIILYGVYFLFSIKL